MERLYRLETERLREENLIVFGVSTELRIGRYNSRTLNELCTSF